MIKKTLKKALLYNHNFNFSYIENLPVLNRYLVHHILYVLDKTAKNHQVGFRIKKYIKITMNLLISYFYIYKY